MNRISGWSRMVLMGLALALSPFALVVSAAHAGDRTVIWETGEGRVALIPQDTGKAVQVTPNNHPVELTDDLLIGLLSSVQVRDTPKDKLGPLFTEGSLQLLAPYIQQAFRKAGPDDDVSFVVVGLYKTMLGFASRAMITSGRVFYKDGKLNLLLGIVKQDIRYTSAGGGTDFRLIAPGFRQTAAQGEWSLVPSEDRPFEMLRNDWVVFDTKTAFAVKPVAAAPPPTATAQPSRKSAAERPLSERLATLNDLKAKGLITEDEYKTKRREIMNEKEPERTPAERLSVLNELKAKGLITDEEYRAKRMQILSDL
jgi:uncharacterized membrane protein